MPFSFANLAHATAKSRFPAFQNLICVYSYRLLSNCRPQNALLSRDGEKVYENALRLRDLPAGIDSGQFPLAEQALKHHTSVEAEP